MQNQNFKDIEIILVDDKSIDNSVELIENYKKEDKRIILIKNKKNKGTFVSRNLGVFISKTKYVIIPDPDDIISKEIIGICYKYGEKYQYDIIRFNIYKGKGKLSADNFAKFHKDRPIYQPELSTYIYYGNDELEIIDFGICNKVIRKKVYIEALNSLNKFYLNVYMTSFEDRLMNFLLYKTAKSLYFIKNIGYMYKKTSESITKKTLFQKSQMQIHFIFIYLEFIFEYTKNTKYEKDMVNLRLNNINQNYNIERLLLNINFNKNFYFYYKVINSIINCIYISDKNVNFLNYLKNIIKNKYSKYKSK
jgi:glycosyltransferase involved in cell wall biosynthesis